MGWIKLNIQVSSGCEEDEAKEQTIVEDEFSWPKLKNRNVQ